MALQMAAQLHAINHIFINNTPPPPFIADVQTSKESQGLQSKEAIRFSQAKRKQATHTHTITVKLWHMIGESVTGNLVSQKLEGGVTWQKGALQ